MSNLPVYTIKRRSKHYARECKQCGGKLTHGRKYVLDPELAYQNNLPVIFHVQCYRLYWKLRGR
jgi:uncharacterized protein with PIN domain